MQYNLLSVSNTMNYLLFEIKEDDLFTSNSISPDDYEIIEKFEMVY